MGNFLEGKTLHEKFFKVFTPFLRPHSEFLPPFLRMTSFPLHTNIFWLRRLRRRVGGICVALYRTYSWFFCPMILVYSQQHSCVFQFPFRSIFLQKSSIFWQFHCSFFSPSRRLRRRVFAFIRITPSKNFSPAIQSFSRHFKDGFRVFTLQNFSLQENTHS